MRFIGMSLVPSLQLPHNPNSKCVHAHGFRTCATPTFGSIVVKGKFPVATLVCVAAEKNVDLPTFALPSNPIWYNKTHSR